MLRLLSRFFVVLTVALTTLAYVEFGFLHAIVVCFFCGAWALLWRLCFGATRASAFEKKCGAWCLFFLQLLLRPLLSLMKLVVAWWKERVVK